ncbi:MAG: hypothetical protein WC508_02945 [Patescibacteria group bacterium]
MAETMDIPMTWREWLSEWLSVCFFFGLFIVSGLILMAFGAGTGEPIGVAPGLIVIMLPFIWMKRSR